MDQQLMAAAEAGDIVALYELIQQDPYLLERIDEIPFVDTPLHKAATAGQTHFAIEIARLKPSFSRKLNPDGLSPIHLALQNNQYETVKRLVSIDSELICVQVREGITPLHYVTDIENLDLLAGFLLACPASIEKLTNQSETAVHIAVKNHKFEAFKILFVWLHWANKEEVLEWKDDEGNTVLHIAANTIQPEVARLLTEKVDINARNLEGSTALDLVLKFPSDQEDIGKVKHILLHNKAKRASSLPNVATLKDIFSSKLPFYERWARFILRMQRELSGNMREILVVVAVLIATATYQAALQPPGGLRQAQASDNNNPPFLNCTALCNVTTTTTPISEESQPSNLVGTTVMNTTQFVLFSLFNTIAFCASIGMLLVLLQYRTYSTLLSNSLIFLSTSYINAMVFISPPGKVPVSVILGLNFLFILLLDVGRRLYVKGKNKIRSATLSWGGGSITGLPANYEM